MRRTPSLAGMRVVRGLEGECRAHHAAPAVAANFDRKA